MEASPFARLSAELRNQIWTHALYRPDGFYLDRHDGNYELSEKGHHIALIKTCRQINTETALLLYNVNKFIFNAVTNSTMRSTLARVKDWLCVIGPAKASAIAEICFDLGHLPQVPWVDRKKKSLRKIFGAIREALYEVPSPCTSLAALTVTVDLEIRLEEGEYVKTLTLELPLTDETEAIRRIEETFDTEKNRVMRRSEFDGGGSGLRDLGLFVAWALQCTDDEDCAELDMWKDALLCVIKEA
ncbi:hypothetical protein KC331_g3830 [Hortaea werneckii]|nr:hypothetical protein KC331_g3830 [Hortaea werneckii]KAI7711531.1 hypothetical protein KC353_g8920 [Hortaea werneckii]